MSGQRIQWNFEEIAKLAAAAIPVVKAQPGLVLHKVILSIQDDVLPPHRRRTLPNIGALPASLRAELTRHRQQGSPSSIEATALAQIQAQLESRQSELEKAQVEIKSLRAHILTLELAPKPPTALEAIQHFIADTLAEAMAKSRAIPGGPPSSPLKPPPPLTKHNPEVQSPPRPRLPKVLICGLKPEQRLPLEAHFKGRLHLSWWMDDSYVLLKSNAKNCDIAFLMMGAVSHDAVALASRDAAQIQRVVSRNTVEQITLIENWLSKWLAKHNGEQNGNS